jgi:tyrosine-protein kinase Etk/Wzc
MNSKLPHSGLGSVSGAIAADTIPESDVDLGRYLEALAANKWLIVAIAIVVTALGVVFALLQRPVYEANLVVQVEDSDGASKNVLGEASTLFDLKTPAAAEMEIIRSRSVIGEAVDATRLYIDAVPRYAPYVGGWLARRATGLSDPGFLGMPGYVTGAERISVPRFETPPQLEGVQFIVTAQGQDRYTLRTARWAEPIKGTVGTLLKADTPDGPIELRIDTLLGKPGAEFYLSRGSRQATIAGLQSNLSLAERGKQSGIINVTLQDANPSWSRCSTPSAPSTCARTSSGERPKLRSPCSSWTCSCPPSSASWSNPRRSTTAIATSRAPCPSPKRQPWR